MAKLALSQAMVSLNKAAVTKDYLLLPHKPFRTDSMLAS